MTKAASSSASADSSEAASTKKAVRGQRAAFTSKAAGSKTLELYFWPTPNGFKITIMLEELGTPYVVKPVNIAKGEQFLESFLKISPNNRIPAIIDHSGPGGQALSIFESGAVLQYLGRKFHRFYPADERRRVEVDEWLFWQVAGLGPMAQQAHHFRHYARTALNQPSYRIDYGASRYTEEVGRLYGVLDHRLEGREFVAEDYSIADIAIWPWIVPWRAQGQELAEFPHLKSWFDRMAERAAVKRGIAVGRELREKPPKAPDLSARIASG